MITMIMLVILIMIINNVFVSLKKSKQTKDQYDGNIKGELHPKPKLRMFCVSYLKIFTFFFFFFLKNNIWLSRNLQKALKFQ